eukprot:COSAG02_NODE_3810_length_6197_cov_7.231223_3_plen_133_part_00
MYHSAILIKYNHKSTIKNRQHSTAQRGTNCNCKRAAANAVHTHSLHTLHYSRGAGLLEHGHGGADRHSIIDPHRERERERERRHQEEEGGLIAASTAVITSAPIADTRRSTADGTGSSSAEARDEQVHTVPS